MIAARRLIAVLCIAAILVTGVMPGGAAFLRGILVPLGPLFGAIVSAPLPRVADADLPAAPALSVRAGRAPPLA